MQTNLLGRLPKKSLRHSSCLYVACVPEQRVRKPQKENVPSLQNYFQRNCWSVIPMLLKSVGTTLAQSNWTKFCRLGTCFCTLGYLSFIFSWPLETGFFSSTVFIISMLVFFLIMRQLSDGVFWRSYFWWTPIKTSVKEHVFTRVASMQLCWKCAALQMFF